MSVPVEIWSTVTAIRKQWVVPKVADVLVRVAFALVGDLPREVPSASELLADDLQHVLGMVVVLAEEHRLWHLRATGEHLGGSPCP